MILNARVFDVETLKIMFYYLDYDINTGEFHEFEISNNANQLHDFVKYIVDRDFEYLIGFNSLNFDMNVVTYIVKQHQGWQNKTGLEIASLISNFASKLIDDTNHGLRPEYQEWELSCPTIDLFKIHHYDNDARRVGLAI